MTEFLYRGMHEGRYQGVVSVLCPKECGGFAQPPEWGSAEWGTSTWNASAINSVVKHQREQAGLPTSGVSTTPRFERARFYALGRSQSGRGYVVAFDCARCRDLGVSLYVVNDIVRHPAAPEDEEVILVAADGGPLPKGIVAEVVPVWA